MGKGGKINPGVDCGECYELKRRKLLVRTIKCSSGFLFCFSKVDKSPDT